MATPEERKGMIEQADSLLTELTSVNPDSLARTDELSRTINFKEAVPHFQDLLDLCIQLRDRDITKLPFLMLQQIVSSCTEIKRLVDVVKGFDINQNTPRDVCKEIISQVQNSYDDILFPLTGVLSFTATQTTDYNKLEREATGFYQNMKERAEKILDTINEYEENAKNALAAVRSVAAETGVSQNAHIFKVESESFGKLARNWLRATIVMGLITLIAAVLFLWLGTKFSPGSTSMTIQYIFGKVVVMSALSFGAFWCSRNYRANRHNETLNKHRANALNTFRAFVEGTDDPLIKNTVLVQAAGAAFTARPTGFEPSESDTQTINPIVEVIRKSAERPDSSVAA